MRREKKVVTFEVFGFIFFISHFFFFRYYLITYIRVLKGLILALLPSWLIRGTIIKTLSFILTHIFLTLSCP